MLLCHLSYSCKDTHKLPDILSIPADLAKA